MLSHNATDQSSFTSGTNVSTQTVQKYTNAKPLSSPMKNNKKGTSAGMPRSGERGVSPMNGHSSATQVSHFPAAPPDFHAFSSVAINDLFAMNILEVLVRFGSKVWFIKRIVSMACVCEMQTPGRQSLRSALAEQPNHSTPTSHLKLATLSFPKCDRSFLIVHIWK